MISDSNHTVVANVVAALVEISEVSGKDMFKINNEMLRRLLIALDACIEWGQVSILDFLAKYVPTPSKAEEIIERIIPKLKHANTAISMSTIKVIIKYLDIIKDSNPTLVQSLITQKLAPP
uniref:AP-1 complex subunit beta n=1 Tax=Lygus hesperus TaxID=30085 RepID=A0A0A9Z584_LYGHE